MNLNGYLTFGTPCKSLNVYKTSQCRPPPPKKKRHLVINITNPFIIITHVLIYLVILPIQLLILNIRRISNNLLLLNY